MENEIMELREEINTLNARIDSLETINRRRKAFTYAKILVKVALILLTIYGVWRGYEYVTSEVPKMLEEKIKDLNPLKSSKD